MTWWFWCYFNTSGCKYWFAFSVSMSSTIRCNSNSMQQPKIMWLLIACEFDDIDGEDDFKIFLIDCNFIANFLQHWFYLLHDINQNLIDGMKGNNKWSNETSVLQLLTIYESSHHNTSVLCSISVVSVRLSELDYDNFRKYLRCPRDLVWKRISKSSLVTQSIQLKNNFT